MQPALSFYDMKFTNDQIDRYSRQLILDGVGGHGQERLLASRALVIGCGGLGSPCAYYLAAAGVGTIGLIDSDTVDLSNLQRQILHGTSDLDCPKVESAAQRLKDLNPDVKIIPIADRITRDNALELIAQYDVIIDGSDNFKTRYLMNDACVLAGKPLVHAGVLRFDGQAMTIIPRRGACYRCLFPEPPEPGSVGSCAESGIMGAVAGILGSIQAIEAIKVLLSIGEILESRLFILDTLAMTSRTISIARNTDCALCGDNPGITQLPDYDTLFADPETEEECAADSSASENNANLPD